MRRIVVYNNNVEAGELFIFNTDMNEEFKIFANVKLHNYNFADIELYNPIELKIKIYCKNNEMIEVWINDKGYLIDKRIFSHETSFYYDRIIEHIKNINNLKETDFKELLELMILFVSSYYMDLDTTLFIFFKEIKEQ